MTAIADSGDLVFRETSTYIRTKCPDYCNLPAMHPVDNLGGEHGDFRGHRGSQPTTPAPLATASSRCASEEATSVRPEPSP